MATQTLAEALFAGLDHADGVDDWRLGALCAQADPEAFYPEKGGSTREAKKLCQTCDVREECLQSALENDERFGIWGGLSERERRSLKKKTAPTSTAAAESSVSEPTQETNPVHQDPTDVPEAPAEGQQKGPAA